MKVYILFESIDEYSPWNVHKVFKSFELAEEYRLDPKNNIYFTGTYWDIDEFEVIK